MQKKFLFMLLGGLLGLIVGLIVGAYLGLVIGGTFLGGLNLYEKIGIEAYELSTYIGSIIGAILAIIFGIKLGLNCYNKKNK